MGVNQFNPLELYDLRLQTIPERSALYSLDPIGIGTPIVESLTSYLLRLSYEHCVLPGILITTSIAPLIIPNVSLQHHRKNIQAIFGGAHTATSMCNGMQSTAANITKVLKQLTQRDDLHLLTMLPWAEVIAAMRLLRNKRTWCPKCYEDWQQTNQILYEPLIWSLNVVTVCPRHHRPLLQQCPHCAQTSSLLTSTSLPAGYCSKCGEWLGTISEAQDNLAMSCESDLKRQCWVVEAIGELLARTPDLSSSIQKARIKAVLVAYVEQVTHGNINALCRLTQQPDSTLHNWLHGQGIPQLTQLLQLCDSLQLSLWDFFTQSIEDMPFSTLCSTATPLSRRSRLKPGKQLRAEEAQTALQAALNEIPPPSHQDVVKRLKTNRTTLQGRFPDLSRAISVRYADYQKKQQYEAIRRQLEIIIETEHPPPSLKEVARRLKTSTDRLRRYCLNLCSTISERHVAYRRTLVEQAKADIQQQVRQIAIELHSKGINPTSGAIGRQMKHPGVFKEKTVQEALRQVRRDLEFE